MGADETYQTKQDLRRCMLGKTLATSEAQKRTWSEAIVGWLEVSDDWLPSSGLVTLFGGSKSEPDLLPLIPWLNDRGVGVAFFSIKGGRMHPYQISKSEDILIGKLGVLEPDPMTSIRREISDIGTVLTPGIAFESLHGHRMGRGAGYYDRFLSSPECRARRIGVGFSLQLCETLPVEKHDVPMEAFVTEKGWFDVVHQQRLEGEARAFFERLFG